MDIGRYRYNTCKLINGVSYPNSATCPPSPFFLHLFLLPFLKRFLFSDMDSNNNNNHNHNNSNNNSNNNNYNNYNNYNN